MTPVEPTSPRARPALGSLAEMRVAIPAYLAAIALAELVTSHASETAGAILNAAIVVAALNHHLALSRGRDGRSAADVLPAIALLPLLRMLSIALPLGEVSPLEQHALVGVPLIVGIVQAARVLRLERTELGLCVGSAPAQLLIALSGIPLGIAAHLIAGPDEPIASTAPLSLLVALLVLALLSALPEELLLRGLLQPLLGRTFGPAAVTWSAAFSTALYLGSLSAAFTVFAAAVAIGFGEAVRRTGSIAGVAAARALLVFGLLVVWPELLA